MTLIYGWKSEQPCKLVAVPVSIAGDCSLCINVTLPVRFALQTSHADSRTKLLASLARLNDLRELAGSFTKTHWASSPEPRALQRCKVNEFCACISFSHFIRGLEGDWGQPHPAGAGGSLSPLQHRGQLQAQCGAVTGGSGWQGAPAAPLCYGGPDTQLWLHTVPGGTERLSGHCAVSWKAKGEGLVVVWC